MTSSNTNQTTTIRSINDEIKNEFYFATITNSISFRISDQMEKQLIKHVHEAILMIFIRITYPLSNITIMIIWSISPGRWFRPQDRAVKMRESHRILKESTRNRWNMETVFRPEIFRIFFGGFLPTSFAFRQEPGGKYWKKSDKFPAGILLPQNHRNRPEPVVSGPDCSNWIGDQWRSHTRQLQQLAIEHGDAVQAITNSILDQVVNP